MQEEALDRNQDEPRYRLVFFASLCIFLSMVEYAIPKPLPFLRLGLANLPLLLSFPKLPPQDVLVLVVLKVVGQGLISGTLLSYVILFSASSSVAAALSMALLYYTLVRGRRRPAVSLVGMSLAGALASSGAQLLVARHILSASAVRYIAPLVLCSGMITGCLLGLFAQRFTLSSRWYASLEDRP